MAKFKSKTNSSSSTTSNVVPKETQKRIPKAEKCAVKLIKRKEWRLRKFGEVKVETMSGTTMKLFKKWGHRANDIREAINRKISTKT